MTRVGELVRANKRLPMADLMELLKVEAQAFGGDAPQLDDITVVLIQRLPENG